MKFLQWLRNYAIDLYAIEINRSAMIFYFDHKSQDF